MADIRDTIRELESRRFRAMIEMAALREAAATQRERLLEKLQGLMKEFAVAEKAGDLPALARIDMAFHYQFLACCENGYLRAAYELIRYQLLALRHRSPIGRCVDNHQALCDAIAQGLVKGPRVFTAGKSIATTGGHADSTNGLNRRLAKAVGDPGPVEGVIDNPGQAREAVRQRYKEGSDVIKITATGGVLSYAKSGQNPQFMLDEVQAIVQTAPHSGFPPALNVLNALSDVLR